MRTNSRGFAALAGAFLGAGLANAGVLPTRTDQIGVNPVTIYPIDHIVQHTLPPDPNAPTITQVPTVTTVDGNPAPIRTTVPMERFFEVEMAENGAVAIKVVNSGFADFLKSVFTEAACGVPGAKARRQLLGRQGDVAVCAMPRPPRPMKINDIQKIKGWKDRAKMISNLYQEMLDKTQENAATADVKKLLQQFKEDNPEWTGTEADAMTDAGVDYTIGADEIGIAELEAQGGASGELGTLGMSVMNMLYRLFQEEIVQGAAAVAVGVKGATVAEDLIKTLQTFRTTTTTTRTTTSSCPAATETNIQRPECGTDNCKYKPKANGLGPGGVCDGGPNDGCDCNPSRFELINFRNPSIDIMVLFADAFTPKDMPVFPPVNGRTECSIRKEVLQPKLFRRLASDFCSTWETWRLDKKVERSYNAGQVAWRGYEDWEFKFKWEPKEGKKCENTCEQIFMDAFGLNGDCAPEDHKFSHKGSIDLECGNGSFEVIDPATKPHAECSPDDSDVSAGTFGGPNASKSTLYGDFCNRLEAGEFISTYDIQADGWKMILSTDRRSGNECTTKCNDAFAAINDACGKRKDAGKLADKGWFDAGCVVYGYEVTDKVEEPKPEEPAPPPANPPPARSICNRDSDCNQWTCDGGKKPGCSSQVSGDPLTKYCAC